MADALDKVIAIGLGLEKKAQEVMEELRKTGEAAREPLTSKETVENKVVDEGVKALKELLKAVNAAKERIEKELSSSSGKVLEKLDVATREDVEVIKEMARVAREKVDKLDKRVEELETIVKEIRPE